MLSLSLVAAYACYLDEFVMASIQYLYFNRSCLRYFYTEHGNTEHDDNLCILKAQCRSKKIIFNTLQLLL